MDAQPVTHLITSTIIIFMSMRYFLQIAYIKMMVLLLVIRFVNYLKAILFLDCSLS